MKLLKKITYILMFGVLLYACKQEKKEEIKDAAEDAVEAVQDAAEDAGEAISDAANDAGEAISDAAEDAKEAVDDAVGSEDGATEEAEGATEKAAKPQGIQVYYPKDTKLADEVSKSIKRLVKAHPELQTYFNKAYGYAIFPIITKAALGVGGAGGKGLVFQNNRVIGRSTLAQATVGLQAGGQQYQEVIFFEDKAALDRFKSGKVKFSGQASAVMLKEGVSADIAYQDGVAIFTKAKGGVMAEASVGGQKFKYHDGI